jgi:hypothetical protein
MVRGKIWLGVGSIPRFFAPLRMTNQSDPHLPKCVTLSEAKGLTTPSGIVEI